MSTAIVKKETLTIEAIYPGAPNIGQYGGPWGDANVTAHVAIPEGMIPSTEVLEVELSEGEIEIVEDSDKKAAYLAAQSLENARRILRTAVAFGNQVIEDFTLENMALGITSDDMTDTVLDNMAPIMAALRSGSLNSAMARIRAVPAEDKDVKYITDARLLAALNKIEQFMGLPLSEDLE